MNDSNIIFKEKKIKIVKDIIFSFFLLCFCILMFFGVKMVPNYLNRNLPTILWPSIVLIFLFTFSLFLLMKSLFEYYQKIFKYKKNEKINLKSNIFDFKFFIRNSRVFLLAFLFCIMCYFFGSVFSIPLFIFMYMRFLGEKNITKVIIISFLADVFFIFLFGVIVGSPLPKGVGFFKNISELFY